MSDGGIKTTSHRLPDRPDVDKSFHHLPDVDKNIAMYGGNGAKLSPSPTSVQHDTYDPYGNKCDLHFIGNKLFNNLDEKVCSSDSIIIIGGTNNGDSSEDILKACPEFTLYGTDIQAVSVNRANKRLHDKGYKNVHIINEGWDLKEDEVTFLGGDGSETVLIGTEDSKSNSLFDSKYLDHLHENLVKVKVRPFIDFVNNHLPTDDTKSVLYIIIDTEGHDSFVIRSMALNMIINRKKYLLFNSK